VNEVFIVDYVSGTPKLAHDSPEQKKVAEGGSAGNQEYTPQWMSVDAFMKLNDVLPAEVGDAVRAYLERRAMEAHK
jgi:hypothetical protein